MCKCVFLPDKDRLQRITHEEPIMMIKAMTAEIQKIGVNVNQIARRVNATGNAYQEDIEEIKGVLAEIWRLQRLSLLKAL